MVEDDQQVESEASRGFPLPGVDRKPLVTWALLAANTIIWVIAGGTQNPDVLLDFGAMFGPLVADGEYWRLFTAMFLHVGVLHLVFNGFGLFIFGQLLERIYGHGRFLTIYILAGLFGSVASYVINSIGIGAGASGAIFGVLGALAAFFVVQWNMFGRMGQRNLTGLMLLVSINLVYGLITPGIDNWAHMGGFAAGFVLGMLLVPKYEVVTGESDVSSRMIDANSLARRNWVVPVSVALLVVFTMVGTATLPENPHTHFYKAERALEQGEYGVALEEVGSAIGLYQSMGQAYLLTAEAHLLRARILVQMGDPEAAMRPVGMALAWGNREIRAEAIELWRALRGWR